MIDLQIDKPMPSPREESEVPLYVLQQLYYKLNNVDINAYILKKEK